MDKTSLNQKAWHRAIKVLFMIAFLIGQGFGFLITYSIVDTKILFVKCDNGKEFESPYQFLYSDAEKLLINQRCNPDEESGESIQEAPLRLSDLLAGGKELIKHPEGYYIIPNHITYYKNKYSMTDKIGFYVISFISVSAIFHLIAKMFFYIVLGEKFFSLKKIRQQ